MPTYADIAIFANIIFLATMITIGHKVNALNS